MQTGSRKRHDRINAKSDMVSMQRQRHTTETDTSVICGVRIVQIATLLEISTSPAWSTAFSGPFYMLDLHLVHHH